MKFIVPTHRHPDSPAAAGAPGPVTAGQLLADADALSKAIAARVSSPRPGASRPDAKPEVLVICADRCHFAAALLAVWKAGCIAALPPNGQDATVKTLAGRPGIRLIVHDQDGREGLDLRDFIGRQDSDADAHHISPLTLDENEVIATLYTSGSTGEHKRCPKAARELLGEAASHVESFGIQPGEIFAATVPGHHIYGLIWSVLVPLLSGGVLDRQTTLFPDAVAAHARDIGATYLVSVPAHLRSLAELDAMPPLKRITSSSAPLPPETALKLKEKFGLKITEIFGSSETGGIAFREEPGAPHRPLAGVKVTCDADGRLLLDSPFLPPGTQRPLPCDDRIELLPDGRFLLKGRLDGVVKIGGKRVALAEVERHLLNTKGVRDAACLAETVDSGRGAELWAAVAAPGLTKDDIRDSLRKWLDPVALPRRIQFVDTLPREENGKLQRAKLRALFTSPGAPSPSAPRNPALSDEVRRLQSAFAGVPAPLDPSRETPSADGQGVVMTIPIPADYYYFRGHFDGLPILPGVVQLEFIVHRQIARIWPDLARSPERIAQLKFKKTIPPGTRLTLSLRRAPGRARVSFELADETQQCSQGQFIFSEP